MREGGLDVFNMAGKTQRKKQKTVGSFIWCAYLELRHEGGRPWLFQYGRQNTEKKQRTVGSFIWCTYLELRHEGGLVLFRYGRNDFHQLWTPESK